VPVNLNTQASPSTETVKFTGVPTVWAQSETVSMFAFAIGAETIEIAESVETAKTKGINEATKRRALRMKAARFNAIPMYSFTDAAGDCLFFKLEMPELVEH
jgi:hypothetical protein